MIKQFARSRPDNFSPFGIFISNLPRTFKSLINGTLARWLAGLPRYIIYSILYVTFTHEERNCEILLLLRQIFKVHANYTRIYRTPSLRGISRINRGDKFHVIDKRKPAIPRERKRGAFRRIARIERKCASMYCHMCMYMCACICARKSGCRGMGGLRRGWN